MFGFVISKYVWHRDGKWSRTAIDVLQTRQGDMGAIGGLDSVWQGCTQARTSTNKQNLRAADMQNPAACHTIRVFSRARFFCVSCIKYNDNCYLPFQESLKSGWIVGHSPNQNNEKYETIAFMWKQIHDSAIVPLSQQTSYQLEDWESMKVPVWDVDISLQHI